MICLISIASLIDGVGVATAGLSRCTRHDGVGVHTPGLIYVICGASLIDGVGVATTGLSAGVFNLSVCLCVSVQMHAFALRVHACMRVRDTSIVRSNSFTISCSESGEFRPLCGSMT